MIQDMTFRTPKDYLSESKRQKPRKRDLCSCDKKEYRMCKKTYSADNKKDRQ